MYYEWLREDEFFCCGHKGYHLEQKRFFFDKKKITRISRKSLCFVLVNINLPKKVMINFCS